ncbi:unnamed protein product [Ophioblennius macclurei]
MGHGSGAVRPSARVIGLPGEVVGQKHDSWEKFFVIQTGKTNDAHKRVIKTLRSRGQKKAESIQDADYCLVFCPVTSRVGTDVSEAIEHLPDGKPAVLVVMHHTFNTKQVIPRSRRLVKDQRVRLTLDCLFHQNKLLNCQFNDKMNAEIRRCQSFRSKKSPMACFTPALDDDHDQYQRAEHHR